MTHDTPQDQQLQPHHDQQEHKQQDFKQKLEALYSQSKSWFDRQQQNLDNLEAHQHDINQASLESLANVKANLQLTRSDVAFLRINIRSQDERIEELRTLIEKNKQLLTAQTETITRLKQERTSIIASKRTLHQRAEKLEADLAAMILRVETLERQLSRLKKNVREHKVAPGRTAITAAEEDRRAQEIQRILSTIHGYEAVHAHALELLSPPSSDSLQGSSSQDPSFQNQEITTPSPLSPPFSPSPQAQPTIYFIADTPREKPSPVPTSTSSTTPPLPFIFTPTTFNPENPFFLTTLPPPPQPPSPPPPSIAATTTTTAAATTTIATAAGNKLKETVTAASGTETSPFQLPHASQPSPPPQPQFLPEKLLGLQRVHRQIENYKAWMNQQTEQSQLPLRQFPHQDQVRDQRPRIPRNPFVTSPQYAHALVSFALSLSVSLLAYITIQIYFFLQPNQQYQQLENLATVCEIMYNTNSMSWMPLEGESFIPT